MVEVRHGPLVLALGNCVVRHSMHRKNYAFKGYRYNQWAAPALTLGLHVCYCSAIVRKSENRPYQLGLRTAYRLPPLCGTDVR